MNIRYAVYFSGRIMKLTSLIFVVPSVFALIYGEYSNLCAFLPIGAGIFALGLLCSLKVPRDKELTAVEGFVIVAFSWVFLSFAVACAYRIAGELGNFMNCLFEAVSGFTTTGASIAEKPETLSKSVNILRCFTHWVGGMGILVLVIAIIPKNTDATAMNIFKAEVPGHQVDKFTDKLTMTAKILYLIYAGLTALLSIAFMLAKMPIFDSVAHAMSIAGTGGFSVRNRSMMSYGSPAIEAVATVGMFLFGINMNIFYLILIGRFANVLRSEELRSYVAVYAFAVLAMSVSLFSHDVCPTFGEAFRLTAFQAASIMSTTGMYAADFSQWTTTCLATILVLMIIGGCAGSTAGGIKHSRAIIALKYARNQFCKAGRPNRVKTIRLEGERLGDDIIEATLSFLALYVTIVFVSTLFVSLLDDFILRGSGHSFLETLTAVISCMSNVGPAFGNLAVGTYSAFSVPSKLVLCFDMLAGRLEILPMLFLFNPFAWPKKS